MKKVLEMGFHFLQKTGILNKNDDSKKIKTIVFGPDNSSVLRKMKIIKNYCFKFESNPQTVTPLPVFETYGGIAQDFLKKKISKIKTMSSLMNLWGW